MPPTAERFLGQSLQGRNTALQLSAEAHGRSSMLREGASDGRCHREPWRNRQSKTDQLGEASTFAAQFGSAPGAILSEEEGDLPITCHSNLPLTRMVFGK